MENEEVDETQVANNQLANQGHKLPEQSRLPSCPIPRPFSFEHLIHQWQPMGFRVVLNLPFVGNDQDYLFAIRNGPFIPLLFKSYLDSDVDTSEEDGSGRPVYTSRQLNQTRLYSSYAFNNMRPVIHAGKNYAPVKPDDPSGNLNYSVYITQYDQPPALATLSTMFRKWRGTMHYRIRVVSGFTTQGYIFSSLIRNSPANVGVYPTQGYVPGVMREDSSYRESMMNSYVMGDTAMFRHFEVEVPFEYPVPYYDQYNWIGNRSRPAQNFMRYDKAPSSDYTTALRSIRNEPHGDNYVVFGLRGRLESGIEKSQITFEIEYRAGEDFQFADPFLPYNDNYLTPYVDAVENVDIKTIQVPSLDYQTDGLGPYIKSDSQLDKLRYNSHYVQPKPVEATTTRRPIAETPVTRVVDNRLVYEGNRMRRRNPRSLDTEDELEGYDTVDTSPAISKLLQTLSKTTLGSSSRTD